MTPNDSANSALALWSGVYSCFHEALVASTMGAPRLTNSLSTAYSSNRWLQNLENRLRLAKLGTTAKPSKLPELVSELRPQAIIDLGGGNGWLWYLLPNWFTETHCPYVVLEPKSQIDQLRHMVEHQRLSWLPSEVPSEWLDLPGPKILYSLSMLQYVGNFEVLESVVQFHRPSWIVLEDVPCASEHQFFTLQNFYEFQIPYRFVSVSDLRTTLANLGYQLDECVNYEAAIDPRVQLRIEGHEDAMRYFKGFMSFRFSQLGM